MYLNFVLTITGSCFLLFSLAKAVLQTDISGLVGSTVLLPCRIDTRTCGTLHSVKWYRGSSRIYIFSDLVKFSKSEGQYELRATFLYKPNDAISHLKIKNITNEDEAIYKCEITYLDVVESCLVVQFINLTTLIAPSHTRIYNENGDEIHNDSEIGPYNEGAVISLTCEVDEGKPVPSLIWYKNDEVYSSNYTVKHGSNTIGRSENKITLHPSRNDLGAVYECRASSQALTHSLIAGIQVKVNVKPSRIELKGFENDVRENDTVKLECNVFEASPEAAITWFNETKHLDEKKFDIVTTKDIRADGTTDTYSSFTFRATRFEHMKLFRCLAENAVMTDSDKAKFEKRITIHVLYAPIVTLRPERVTINESKDVLLTCEYAANPFALGKTIWYFNGKILSDNDIGYEMKDIQLKLKKANRKSLGKYICSISNEVATTNSSEAFVNVLYPPAVFVDSDASTVVNESSKANISLQCRVSNGNPRNLIARQWYFNNELIYNYTTIDDFVLQNVDRRYHGNYSCQGTTEAGEGSVSQPKEIFVQYQPGSANILLWVLDAKGNRLEVKNVIKGSTVMLQCNVENLGIPTANKYNWYEGNRRRETVSGTILILEKVGVKEAINMYSCNAENAAGPGTNGTMRINIKAPPTFINTMKYANPTIMDDSVNMTCDIECDPICQVKWKKNYTVTIESGNEYEVINRINNASLDKNDFKSVTSTLVINLTRFPDGHAKPVRDDTTYTCYSTGNGVGEGVKADILYEVHYPPTNVLVSQQYVDVTEGRIPGKVSCKAEAKPEATIRWFSGNSNSTFSTEDTLTFASPLTRTVNTNFTCEASNKYGVSTNWVYFNVRFKPECQTTVTEDDDKKFILCRAVGNPSTIMYNWTSDASELINIRSTNEGSALEVEDNSETKIYNCTAYNDIGASETCSMKIPASDEWWFLMLLRSQNWSMVYIIVAVTVVILIILIVCIPIILICKKRRAKEKCAANNSSDKRKDNYHSPHDALLQFSSEKGFYENLPFHGMQNPPNKPFRPEFSDLDYADVDDPSYGPINYKAASIYAAQKRNNSESQTKPEDYLL